jgi:hypothetical protein
MSLKKFFQSRKEIRGIFMILRIGRLVYPETGTFSRAFGANLIVNWECSPKSEIISWEPLKFIFNQQSFFIEGFLTPLSHLSYCP